MSFWSRIERRLEALAGEILPDEFHDQLEGARRLLEQGRPEDAAQILQAVLDIKPDHAAALALLGGVRLELRDPRSALEAFDRALAQKESLPAALLGRGEACLALGDLPAATTAFRAAVAHAAGERGILALAYRGLGLAHRRAGDRDKAVRELRKAVAEAPNDPAARALLGEALLAVSAEEARRHLSRAAESDRAPALTFLALGALALGAGDSRGARRAFSDAEERARREGDEDAAFDALIGAGDAALAAGDHGGAHQCFLRALELRPESPRVHARLGEAHRSVGAEDRALESYRRALNLGGDADVSRRALETALAAGEDEEAARLAEPLLAADPDDPRGLVARGRARAAAGDRDGAEALYRRALAAGEDLEAHLALGQLWLEEEETAAAGRRAAEEALAALRLQPHDRRARELLAEARAQELGRAASDDDSGAGLYEIATDLHRVCLARPELGELAGEVSRAAADLDNPLLVTVMGEFSSGKSSFVNAFVGYEVAPTGITPTTATINVVKHGRERAGRIVYRDGRAEELGWEGLFPTLQELSAERAREVSVVEILLPQDELERVNLVDTPGLNSILPEHEEVARSFIARADAVLWLFTAGQAGKASEREALEKIRDQGVRVLGVLNKVDQLSEEGAGEVVKHVEGELAELVEAVVPLSARRAMERRIRGQGEDDGNFTGLADALEERFFARARELKQQAADRRLAALLDRARRRVDAGRERAASAARALRDAAEGAAAARDGWQDVVAAERRHLVEASAALYRSAAREVLELARPRRLPFGSHTATPADRDYLISLLSTGYESALEPSRQRVVQAIREAGDRALAGLGAAAGVVGGDTLGDLERTLEDAIRLVDARVFARCQAYLQGYVRGGFVDAFFRRDLPKLELTEDAVYHALFRDSPNLDDQIEAPLAEAGRGALDAVFRRLSHLADVADVLALDMDVGALDAVSALEERRGRLSP